MTLDELIKQIGTVEVINKVFIEGRPSYRYEFGYCDLILQGNGKKTDYFPVGNGNTEDQAKNDYIEKIKGRTIYFFGIIMHNSRGHLMPARKCKIPNNLTLK